MDDGKRASRRSGCAESIGDFFGKAEGRIAAQGEDGVDPFLPADGRADVHGFREGCGFRSAHFEEAEAVFREPVADAGLPAVPRGCAVDEEDSPSEARENFAYGIGGGAEGASAGSVGFITHRVGFSFKRFRRNA